MAIFEPIETSENTRRRLSLKNPATMADLGDLECASKEDVQKAVQNARKAQVAWGALPIPERAKYLYKLRDQILDNQDEIIATVVSETGKSPHDAMSMEIYAACDSISYYSKRAAKFLKPQKKTPHGIFGLLKKLKIVYKPLGVVGIISPWNGPFILSVNPSIQALLAGNCVIVKGSEVTPNSTAILEKLARNAGFPEGVLQVLSGDGQTGADLVESGLDKVAFTGSVATGRKVAQSCGQQLIPVSLELGGKDAMIVCEDADLERAADGAVLGSCMNTGHYCCGTERIYVMDSVYDEFLQKVVEKTKALKQGQQHGKDEDVGAVFWDRQMTIIERHVQGAKAAGATVHVGGQRSESLEGLYFEPTVLTDLTHDMEIMTEETFGPVIAIMKVRNVSEALRLANDSNYGLNGNVWSKNLDRGAEIAAQIDTGGACVNDIAITYGVPAAPFGGRKASGVGQVNGGEAGLRGFSHGMPIIVDRFGGKLQGGYPFSADAMDEMKKFMDFLWKSTPGKMLSKLFQ